MPVGSVWEGKWEHIIGGGKPVYISDLEIGVSTTVKISAIIKDTRGHDGDKGYITYEFIVIRAGVTEYSILPLTTEVVMARGTWDTEHVQKLTSSFYTNHRFLLS